jgi:hypothetical protein
MEWLIYLPGIFVGLGSLVACYQFWRKQNAAEYNRVAISPQIREELDQGQLWWNEEYHRSLVAAGVTPTAAAPEYEYDMSLNGETKVIVTTQAFYEDCNCRACSRAKVLGGLEFG